MRYSLRKPIPELDLAAKLLDAAADALLSGRYELAKYLLDSANFPEIREYAISIVGKLSIEVHRQTKRPNGISNEQRDLIRMPSQKQQDAIFARDGWRCRFCGVKVVCKQARSRLTKIFRIEPHWTSLVSQRHSALYALASSLDHIVPHGRGGKNEQPNYVTACYCCQFGRGEFTLAEVELENPIARPPLVDNWDGLTRLREMEFPISVKS